MSGWFPKVQFDAAERRKLQRLTRGLKTKADKIRALAAAGHSRAKIAGFLGIRYQHVRNVLGSAASGAGSSGQTRHPRGLGDAAPDAPQAWETSAPDRPLTYGRATVDEKGRLILPEGVLALLEVRAGGWIPWRFEDGELKLMSRAAGLRSAQAMVADLVKKHPGSWADELIAERRAEAAREDAEERRG